MTTRCARGPAGTATSPLAMLAHAYLAAVRQHAIGGEGAATLAAALLPLTVPEIRRLLFALVWARPPNPARILAWSDWRRAHQQCARRCHWKGGVKRYEPRL